MKKLIATTLCVAMCLSLIACGDTKNETPKNNATIENTTDNTTQAKENPADEAPSVEIPEVVISDKDDVGNIAGKYVSFTDDSTVEVKLDASTADSSVGTVVGNSTVNYDQSTYSGQLEKVATNVYHLKVDDADIFLGFFFVETQIQKSHCRRNHGEQIDVKETFI